MNVKPIPDGYHTLTPYFAVRDAAGLIEFLQQAFDANVTERLAMLCSAVMMCEAATTGSQNPLSEAAILA